MEEEIRTQTTGVDLETGRNSRPSSKPKAPSTTLGCEKCPTGRYDEY